MIYVIKSIDNKEVNLIKYSWEECKSLVWNKTAVYRSYTDEQEKEAAEYLKTAPVNKSESGHGYVPVKEGKCIVYGKYIFDRCPTQDNGFSVKVYENKKGQRFSCQGFNLPDNKKLLYSFQGVFIKDKRWGYEFVVESYMEHVTDTKDSIITYLSSGIIKGIGEKKAEKIYEKFGSQSMEIFEKCPDKLRMVSGISKKGLEQIVESYNQNKCAREITTFLLKFGISQKYGMIIYKQYGANAVEVIKKNPYLLCALNGITFEDSDNIAKQEGYPMDGIERFFAAVRFVLKTNELQGHTGMEQNDLGNKLKLLLGKSSLSNQQIQERIIQMIKDGVLKIRCMQKDGNRNKYIFTKEMYLIEADISEKLWDLANQNNTDALENYEKEFALAEQKFKTKCDDIQKSAAISAMQETITVINGGPGTGKTTTIRMLDFMYRQKYPERRTIFLAPTGRAARKIAEATNEEAFTIHSYLHVYDNCTEDDEVIIEDSLVVIDEFSMTDTYIAQKLCNAIGDGCKVVFVGDADQLPSVGPGAVLRDIINSGIIHVVTLKKVYRQGENTEICENAKKIKEGNTDIREGSDFHITQCTDMEDVKNTMADLYVKRVEEFGVKNVMCLCPIKKHTAGVFEMNVILQERVNPKTASKLEIKYHGTLFREGDLVMQTANNDNASNGDIGVIEKIIITDGDMENAIVLVDINGEDVEYEGKDMDILTLAYAMTVHKSQGSEADAVVTCLTNFHTGMIFRNIPYVAISRGKKQVDFVGDVEALKRAIITEKSNNRVTLLSFFLKYLSGQFVA